ncbi:hypothetical protein FDB34_06160 [Clostridium botulinum]|nr:hypothetical protein [Clostridium botulinum]
MKNIKKIFCGEINKKFIISMLSLLIFISFILSFFIYYENQRVNVIDFDKAMVENSSEISYFIDNIIVGEKSSSIQGWAIKPGEDIEVVECYVVLNKVGSNKYLKLNTNIEKRLDLNSAFNDGYSYENGGFFAKILNKKLEKNCDYDIYLLYQNNNENYLINTQRKLYTGEI